MPELPDVESFRRYFEKNSLHKKISSILVKHTRILDKVTQERLKRLLEGKEFISTFRHGKNLFLETSDKIWISMHFGMTGHLVFFNSPDQEPNHDRLLISFLKDGYLAYVNQRLLGRVGVTNSPADYIESHNLGKDALELSKSEFIQLLKGKKRTLKSFLMDQEIIAGIGNEYSDEILFHSKLHPSRITNELSNNEISMLYITMINILNEATNIESSGNKFPDRYLLKSRKVGKSCPVCGTPIISLRFSGRTAYLCPNCQKEQLIF